MLLGGDGLPSTLQERIAKAQGEWEAAKRQGNATSQVVLQLAKQNSILSGKCILFALWV